MDERISKNKDLVAARRLTEERLGRELNFLTPEKQKDIFRKIRKECRRIVKDQGEEEGQKVLGMIIIGSWARGNVHDKSDLDYLTVISCKEDIDPSELERFSKAGIVFGDMLESELSRVLPEGLFDDPFTECLGRVYINNPDEIEKIKDGSRPFTDVNYKIISPYLNVRRLLMREPNG